MVYRQVNGKEVKRVINESLPIFIAIESSSFAFSVYRYNLVYGDLF